MRPRSLVAFLMTIALAMVCGSDLLFARARGCGPHPCCVKGACKMMPKSGARFDRCGDDQPNTVQSPMLLTTVDGFVMAILSSPSAAAITAAAIDGASFGVDRPPRG
jgi:hypothetical protein